MSSVTGAGCPASVLTAWKAAVSLWQDRFLQSSVLLGVLFYKMLFSLCDALQIATLDETAFCTCLAKHMSLCCGVGRSMRLTRLCANLTHWDKPAGTMCYVTEHMPPAEPFSLC